MERLWKARTGSRMRPMEQHPGDPNLKAGDLTHTRAADAEEATRRVGGTARAGGASSGSMGSSAIDHGRFLPGTILADRYRIVELLGKGGMGEVYRADDLRLGQMIALKFLTSAQAGTIEALHHEVRIARQVAHPNVCRVYDIGEVDGVPFISMEYIDGEHLGSLLKRIGRLPEDKAVEIATQLCLGLAAIHEQGLIHRDLKPTNVMIDGRGKVRITDFGLAGIAVDLAVSRERAGTPAYMAPEQISGRGVSPQSDIYSLGLVLYELFTGKRAFEGKSWADFVRVHDTQTPVSPGQLIERLDPAIERAIMRCLEKNASDRPASALAVAMSLPGGDPLRAALAAGELPSPEVVAAARAPGALRPGIALGLLLFVIGGMLMAGWMARTTNLLYHVNLPRPPAVLADRAREMLSQLGYVEEPFDARHGFAVLGGYREWIQQHDRSPERWDPLRADQPPALLFWYRESPRWLAPTGLVNGTLANDPPLVVEGMIRLLLTPLGRLESLYVVPQRAAPSSVPTAEPNWSQLFALAGLPEDGFEACEASFVPPMFCDAVRSWRGMHPGLPNLPIQIRAGALFGRPVYFDIVYDWEDKKSDYRPITETAQEMVTTVNTLLAIVAFGGAMLLAWRNVRLGRSDRTGAWRLAFVIALATLTSWLVSADHYLSGESEVRLLIVAGGVALLRGALAWLLYLALEPSVRRRSPETLISWTRILNGRLGDPTVGRDLLIGLALGCLAGLIAAARVPIGAVLGYPAPMPTEAHVSIIDRTRDSLFPLIDGICWAVSPAMVYVTLIVLALIVVRSRVVAVNLVYVLTSLVAGYIAWNSSEQPPVTAAVAVVFVTVLTIGLVRGGLLVLVAAMYAQSMISTFLMWFDFNTWYYTTPLIGFLSLSAIAAIAMYVSLAGRPLLRTDFLDR